MLILPYSCDGRGCLEIVNDIPQRVVVVEQNDPLWARLDHYYYVNEYQKNQNFDFNILSIFGKHKKKL